MLAIATSLPELSTGITSARMGDYQLAIGDILGGNAFLPVRFLPATVLAGQAVLPAAGRSDIYLTALGAILTVIYMAGLIFRPTKHIARMGVDSLTVLLVYLLGIIGLITLQRGGSATPRQAYQVPLSVDLVCGRGGLWRVTVQVAPHPCPRLRFRCRVGRY